MFDGIIFYFWEALIKIVTRDVGFVSCYHGARMRYNRVEPQRDALKGVLYHHRYHMISSCIIMELRPSSPQE